MLPGKLEQLQCTDASLLYNSQEAVLGKQGAVKESVHQQQPGWTPHSGLGAQCAKAWKLGWVFCWNLRSEGSTRDTEVDL